MLSEYGYPGYPIHRSKKVRVGIIQIQPFRHSQQIKFCAVGTGIRPLDQRIFPSNITVTRVIGKRRSMTDKLLHEIQTPPADRKSQSPGSHFKAAAPGQELPKIFQ